MGYFWGFPKKFWSYCKPLIVITLYLKTTYTANISAVNFTAIGCITFAIVVWLYFEVYSIITEKQLLKPKNSSSLKFFSSFDTLLDPRGAKVVEITITSKTALFEMILRANTPVCIAVHCSLCFLTYNFYLAGPFFTHEFGCYVALSWETFWGRRPLFEGFKPETSWSGNHNQYSTTTQGNGF